MSERQDPARQQSGTRRQRQAAQTRQEILAAARSLFAGQGYSATSINDIASEAGVAVQTIYSSVGSKAELLAALAESIGTSADVPALDRAGDVADDPLDIPRIAARLRRNLMESGGDVIRVLLEVMPSEPEVAAIWQYWDSASRAGIAGSMHRLKDLEALTPDLTIERATDRTSAITHPYVYLELLEHGWGHDEIEAWLAVTLTRTLVHPRFWARDLLDEG